MAGTAKPITRGALPLDSVIVDTINAIIDDIEALRNALATHTHTGANPVAPTAATIAAVDAAADMKGFKLT